MTPINKILSDISTIYPNYTFDIKWFFSYKLAEDIIEGGTKSLARMISSGESLSSLDDDESIAEQIFLYYTDEESIGELESYLEFQLNDDQVKHLMKDINIFIKGEC